MSIKVSVKWGKQEFKDIEIDFSQPAVLFKTQLFSMTGVPIERQKIMVKGGMLKDDSDWSTLGLKNGQKLMMMGTADAIPVAPTQEMKFVEDLPEAAQAYAESAKLGMGLVNVGNTCYMNSIVQCLFNIPELKDLLASLNPSTQGGGMTNEGGKRLTLAAAELFKQLSSALQPVTPFQFISTLRQCFPQFSQQGPQGGFMQQDAEECYSQLMYSFRETMRNSSESGGGGGGSDPVTELMGLRLKCTLKCEETGEKSQEDQTVYTAKCNITAEVNHVHEGLRIALLEDREKTSPILDRMALWKGSSEVTHLPKVLTLQFVRFFWKTNISVVDGPQGVKSKILRKVSYPLVLDMYEFCDAALKAELTKGRQAMLKIADEAAAKKLKMSEDTSASGEKVEAKEGEDASMGEASGSGFEEERPKLMTGHYDLVAVLTHKGRAADSGHYIAYCKRDNNQWVVCDDETLGLRTEEDIKNLQGGGDHHMAYLCMYKARYA